SNAVLPETGHTMETGNAVLGGQALDVPLSSRRWSLDEWLASEAAWSTLLARSPADALFLSWDWLTLWWQCFAPALAAVPEIRAFYRGPELVGVAPLYRRRVVRSRLVRATSLQLIGMSWRDLGPTMSEYLDIVALDADADAVRSACAGLLLSERSWSEWVIGFSAASRQWCEAFAHPDHSPRPYVRVLDREVSYQADLSSGFDHYLCTLGQSTRRSLWNLRRRLALQGPVSFELLTPADIDSGLEELNRLHCLRWQQPAFAGAALEFHKLLARRLAARGELALSRLCVGGRVVSLLYDIRKGARQYNISLGFDPSFSGKLSIGLLHLGYAMEAAAERQVRIYDFLAGSGLLSDYKRHLSQARRSLSCVQVLRGYLLPPLYRLHDRVH
ncbi:MAG TPA: GNAT family N-acetyltransferase, partial [Steroidobacteraceae bacterium]|nr:GNAT family N-acetyltransferase [Steroidobacteraceae bacterium]